jgi:NAD(P) transhydrogenase
MLYAMGRVANLEHLRLERVGLVPTIYGHLEVDYAGRTPREHIYAVGDVVGPPALASSAMEQGRRAACHACGMNPGGPAENIPIGIYAIPELSSIGLNRAQAEERYPAVVTGRAAFSEIARGQISGIRDGFLELVCNPEDHRLLGVQIVGEGATELIHIGEMALMKRSTLEDLVEGVFNFPTFAQAYRDATLAALDKLSTTV